MVPRGAPQPILALHGSTFLKSCTLYLSESALLFFHDGLNLAALAFRVPQQEPVHPFKLHPGLTLHQLVQLCLGSISYFFANFLLRITALLYDFPKCHPLLFAYVPALVEVNRLKKGVCVDLREVWTPTLLLGFTRTLRSPSCQSPRFRAHQSCGRSPQLLRVVARRVSAASPRSKCIPF